MLAETGRAPKSAGVLHYEWYNTPNIRFFTIADFEDFCRQKNIQVHRRIALDTEARRGGVRAPEPERRPGDLRDQPRLAAGPKGPSLVYGLGAGAVAGP